MKNANIMLGALAGAAIVGSAGAAEILVTEDITESVTWTADNTYNLQTQIYVRDGATLTIEAGTVVASTPSANGSGSLAITRGSQIFVQGTQAEPVIMTSTNDDFMTWREAANEWGNLTIMGRAYISEDAIVGNTPVPNANNFGQMEGLTEEFPGDLRVRYGGGDDDDTSGSISYLSIRYGGRVVGLTNELNGLSLGGIGRGTDISHVEIMNNVDDGIEIWGGTVNLKYISIWNIGDDSFDVDQGWRGQAQFGLIVQGYSVDASQGSGVGDNAIEIDGAEDSDWQPVTTTQLYNFTVLGQPASGDGLTAWRDNARVQYRSSIFMDGGERVVRFDGDDGDGAQGYGHNGTLDWASTWTTSASTFSSVNAPANPSDFYQSQDASGFLSEIRDSVFFRNLNGSAYTESDARGVTVGGGSNAAIGNVVIPGFDDADAPIAALVREVDDVDGDGLPGRQLNGGALTMFRVLQIDPRAANEAVNGGSAAPDNGFYTPVTYAGAFGPDENWLCGWTAADQFGFVIAPPGGCVIATPCPGDFDMSGAVDFSDLLAALSSFGSGPGGDVDGDGDTDFNDILGVLAAFGPCP